MKYRKRNGSRPTYLVVADLLNAGVPPVDIAAQLSIPVDNIYTLAGYGRRKGMYVKDYRAGNNPNTCTRVSIDKRSIPNLVAIAHERKMSMHGLVITILSILEDEETLTRNLLEN